MEPRSTMRESQLTALLIAPDRSLAEQFSRTIPQTRAFQILADLKTYPSTQTLDIRLRQLSPDVILLDIASNLEAAGELIRFAAGLRPAVQVVGLHTQNASDSVLKILRWGAAEFLHAPFDPSVQREAISRIRRLRAPETPQETELGKVIVFASAKPGAGASTLATQTAFALKRLTGRRVLLADGDLMGGTIGFYLKLNQKYSFADALAAAEQLDTLRWNSLTVESGGVDILPAPDAPFTEPVESHRLHDVLEYARMMYDWVILDLPAVFYRISLLALSESDQAYIVSTSELPSLHLTRKALNLFVQLGFGKDRFQVVINRVNKRDGIGGSDIEKLFNCPVHALFPNDYFSLHRVVTLGQPLGGDCELGRAIESLASRISGAAPAERKRLGGLFESKPVLTETGTA